LLFAYRAWVSFIVAGKFIVELQDIVVVRFCLETARCGIREAVQNVAQTARYWG
jgi:hypothetical protein